MDAFYHTARENARACTKMPGRSFPPSGRMPLCTLPSEAAGGRACARAPEQHAQHADEREVRGIIDVKELAHRAPFAACAVIAAQQRDGERCAELHERIYLIYKEEIHERIHGRPHHEPAHLLSEVSARLSHEQDRHRGHAAPVRREGDGADHKRQHELDPAFQPRVVVDDEQHESPRERPDDARLVERPGGQRHKRDAEAEIIREVRDGREREQARRVLFHIVRVVIALNDEKPHDRRRHAAEQVQQKHPPRGAVPRPERPREVVERHGEDGDALERVAAQGRSAGLEHGGTSGKRVFSFSA